MNISIYLLNLTILQALLDELEQRIELCHQKGLEEEEIAHKASQASDQAADTHKLKKKGGKTGKTPGNCYIIMLYCSGYNMEEYFTVKKKHYHSDLFV